MQDDTPDPVQLARRLADALEAAGLPYAVGGAIALAYWAPPRGTADVDINVFAGADEVARVDAALDVLVSLGISIDRANAWSEIEAGGCVRGVVGRTAVDTFFDSIPLHDSAADRVVVRPLQGRPARILSAEDLIVLKLLFFRGKDILDVERIVATMGQALDRAYVRSWLLDCVGEDDQRVLEWDQICEAVDSGAP